MTPRAFYDFLESGITSITLPFTPIPATLIVSLNGLVQTPGSDYTLTGAAIAFLALDPADTPTVTAHYWTAAATLA